MNARDLLADEERLEEDLGVRTFVADGNDIAVSHSYDQLRRSSSPGRSQRQGSRASVQLLGRGFTLGGGERVAMLGKDIIMIAWI